MVKKEELLKEIEETKADIKDLEQKLLRSQSAIVEAVLEKQEPNERDAQYFKTLASLIKLQREKLQMLSDELGHSEK